MSALALSLGLTGCLPLQYTDQTGARHVVGIGLVNMTVPAQKADPSIPTLVSVASIGIALHTGSAKDGGGFTLGADRRSVLTLPEGACVDVAVAGPCADLARAKTSVSMKSGSPEGRLGLPPTLTSPALNRSLSAQGGTP